MTTLQGTYNNRHKEMTTLQDRDRHKVMTTLQGTYNNRQRNDNPTGHRPRQTQSDDNPTGHIQQQTKQ